ncbi:glycoside hydrolase family 30 protein, partial [Pelagicoccus mobilis]
MTMDFTLRRIAILGGLFCGAIALGETEVEVWLTTESLDVTLEQQEDVLFKDDGSGGGLIVDIDEDTQYQTIDGWGVSLTGASSWLITERLSDAKRQEVMESLFGPTGIGLSMLRQTIGASDFNLSTYSYNDGEEDPQLERFSIERDREYILPRIRDALSINPQIKVMGSPWSPPGWMKSSGDLIGGTLLNTHYETNADYLVKFIQAYEEEGVPIYAITPQNEPGYSPAHYPGMILTKNQQIRFIGDYLGPALRTAGLDRVKIICHDHNYDGLDIPQAILSSSASEYVAGSGFHHYGGPIQAMSTLNSEFPEKGIWFTEGGFGEWNDHFDNIVHEMIEIPRNWAKAIVLWNAALDQNSGPSVIGEDNPNEGMLLIRSDSMDQVSYNGQYYYLGHLSKFVRPGAVRIASPSWIGDLETVAFKNLDSSVALVVANRSQSARRITVNWRGKHFEYEVPRRCMITYQWGG